MVRVVNLVGPAGGDVMCSLAQQMTTSVDSVGVECGTGPTVSVDSPKLVRTLYPDNLTFVGHTRGPWAQKLLEGLLRRYVQTFGEEGEGR